MVDLADKIAAGGTAGLILALIVALFVLATGVIRVGRLVDRDARRDAEYRDRREAQLAEERDEWKALAQGATPEIKRLGDLLATAMALLQQRPPPP